MTKLPRAVIWDLDGTLIDSAADLSRALNALLSEHGLGVHSVELIKTMIGGGIARLVDRGWAAHGKNLHYSEIEILSGRFLDHYARCATDETRLYDSVEDVVRELRSRGVAQAICTNKPSAIAALIIEHLGIAEVFDTIIGGDTTAKKKPDPLPVQSCLAAMKILDRSAVMVGDSKVDVAAGQAAGLPVVLVRHGYSHLPVDSLGADAVIDNISGLFDALPVLRWAA